MKLLLIVAGIMSVVFAAGDCDERETSAVKLTLFASQTVGADGWTEFVAKVDNVTPVGFTLFHSPVPQWRRASAGREKHSSEGRRLVLVAELDGQLPDPLVKPPSLERDAWVSVEPGNHGLVLLRVPNTFLPSTQMRVWLELQGEHGNALATSNIIEVTRSEPAQPQRQGTYRD